jgi:hypothetical protein
MSIARPSVSKIADLYQGNPQALEKRIESEPKGPTGLPLDLSKLMALNIGLTEQDAAKRQAALAGLQQMQQQNQGGEPPTVAQTIQQAAMQRAKTIALQQQREQQGLQALAQQQRMMGAVPENTPQPERQPSGIDELATNIGENFAGGGIVAFTPGGDVEDKDKLTEKEAREILYRMRQRTDMRPESMAVTDMDTSSIPGFVAGNRFQQELDKINRKEAPLTPQQMEARVKAAEQERPAPTPREPYKGPQQVTQRELAEAYVQKRQRQREEDANKPEDEMLKLVKMPFQAAGRGILGALKSLYGQQTPGAMPEQAGIDQNAGEAIMQAVANREAVEDNRPIAIGNEAQRSLPSIQGNYVGSKAKSLPDLNAQRTRQQPVQDAAINAAVNKPGIPASPAAASMVDPMKDRLLKFFEASLNKSPEEQRNEAIERYKKMIGEPDTSAQEKYIQQLEASRSRFAEPEDPIERARNHLRALANAGGRYWFETGAKASAAEEARKTGNKQKDIEVLKELMAESSKLADQKRGYKKDLFGFGEKTYDDAFKNGMDSAKELGLYGRQAELFAHQSAEKVLDRISAQKIASMPSGEERMFNRFAADWVSKPENKGKSISDAYSAYKLAASPSATKGIMTRDQASDNVMKKIAYDSPIRNDLMTEARDALKKAGIASPSASQITDYLIDKEMGRANAPSTSSGKVVDFSSLPK